MTISIRAIRKMILITLVLIVFSNIANWAADFLPKVGGAIWGLVTAGVAFYCRSRASGTVKANRQYYLWLLVPGVLSVIPLIVRLRTVFHTEQVSWWLRIWQMMPIVVNFIVPVTLLWAVYSSLEAYDPEPKRAA